MNLEDRVTIELSLSDAIRAYYVLGRTNGGGYELWTTLGEKLGIKYAKVLSTDEERELNNTLNVNEYAKIRRMLEDAYMREIHKQTTLMKIDELQKQIDELKGSIEQ